VLDRADQLAGYAAIVVGEAIGQRAATVHVEQLRSALRTQTVVDAARDIVMRRRHLDPDAALQLLLSDAGRQIVPLRVLAQRVVDKVLVY
jgi:AmiR/NasT family two-component response regulator